MPYQNKQELIALLKKENLYTKKHLGQNFLTSIKIIDKIIKAANITKEDFVVEVGPGLGILTKQLLNHAKKVHSIELDPEIIPYIIKTFDSSPNFELEVGTALKAKLPTAPYKLVANIPYYITSPLLKHFLNPKDPSALRPQLIVLLVQKEVAEKICADTGNHSILSLQTQIFGKPSIISSVAKTNFYPEPKVESAILKIIVYPEPLIKNLKLFSQITSIAFTQRRKTLLNTIKNHLKLTREEAEALFTKLEIDPLRRPQTLSIQEWDKLVNNIKVLRHRDSP